MQKVAATSRNKQKLLRRLKKDKHQEEEKLAHEVAQKLLSEHPREAADGAVEERCVHRPPVEDV